MAETMSKETFGGSKVVPGFVGDGQCGDWAEHRMMVLDSLRCLHERDALIEKKLDLIFETINQLKVEMKVEIAKMHVKAGIWTVIAGVVPVTIVLVFIILKGVL